MGEGSAQERENDAPRCGEFRSPFFHGVGGPYAAKNTLSDSAPGGSLMDKMQGKSDSQLLREYAENSSEIAFTEIVARYTDLVYASALRQVGSPDLARDVAQSVFTDLARKAAWLARKMKESDRLMGWLYRGTRFEALP